MRQANAATILLRLNEPATVWLLLQQPLSPSQHQPIDPHLRTVLIHQMSRMGADAQALALRLPEEPDSGVRQALILALGEYPANALGVAE